MTTISETAGMNLVVPVHYPDGAAHRRLIANSLNSVVQEHGLPPRWNTMALNIVPDDLSAPGCTAIAGSGVKVRAFDPVDNEYMHFTGIIPHGYVEGTPMKLNVRWIPTDSQTGVVVWQANFYMTSPGRALVVERFAAVSVTAEGVIKTGLQAMVSISGAFASSMIIGTLRRNANESGDTYPGDAGLIGVDLLIQMDAKGSQDQYVKYVVPDGG